MNTTGWSLPSVCKTLRSTDRAWYAASPEIDNRLRRSIRAGANQSIVQANFKEFITNHYGTHEKLYTDGSKDNGKVGAGIVSCSSNLSFCLPDPCSVFSAEAFALKTAVSNLQGNNAIILTDSASCIDALSGGKSRHPWIQSIENMVDGQPITFSWIPGHSGIAGNEKADELAKQGRSQPLLDVSIPAQDVIRTMKSKIWEKWELQWHRSTVHLRQIKTIPTKYSDRKSSAEQRVLSRLRIGHTRVTHAYLMTNNPPPMCNYCGVQVTVHHMLTECRGLEQIRKSCGISGSLYEILGYTAEKEEAIVKFLIDCNLFNAI